MCYMTLSENERYQIYVFKKAGRSQNFIASLLNIRPSTISLELCGYQG